MGAYPEAFEQWYRDWLQDGGFAIADEKILAMKEAGEVKSLEEGEARLRRMHAFAWKLRVEEAKRYHPGEGD